MLGCKTPLNERHFVKSFDFCYFAYLLFCKFNCYCLLLQSQCFFLLTNFVEDRCTFVVICCKYEDVLRDG